MRINKWLGLGLLIVAFNASFAAQGVVVGGRNSGPNALVNTANTAITANNALKLNGETATEMTVGTANIAITANNALKLNGETAAEMTVGTANFALTANYVDWSHVGNAAQILTNNYQGDVTINGRVSANMFSGSGALLEDIGHSSNAIFDTGIELKIVNDVYVTAKSMVVVSITSATLPVGVWTVTPAAGSFSIRSYMEDGVTLVNESLPIAFDYYIVR